MRLCPTSFPGWGRLMPHGGGLVQLLLCGHRLRITVKRGIPLVPEFFPEENQRVNRRPGQTVFQPRTLADQGRPGHAALP